MYKVLILVICSVLFTAGCSVTQPMVEPFCPTVEPVCPQVQLPDCPEPEKVVVEKIVTKEVPAKLPPMATTAGKMHYPIVGAVEWVTVNPSGLRLEARIDTGAETTSIHAEEIQLVEKDGKRYVHFKLVDPESGEVAALERELRRKVRIKQTTGPSERRYVVMLWVELGQIKELIEVTLSDRTDFEYPLLVGRNFLTDIAIVDVSRHHTVAK